MSSHQLKCHYEYFDAIKDGRKTFEVRYNDRGYRVGDVLELRRTTISGEPTEPPEVIFADITYLLDDSFAGLEPGYCVLGIRNLKDWSGS